ncbi:polysaccharide biosynthesis/export family protein [Rhodovibrio salinarum]|nr:polysaccharide biosynthesis/export family protein [Rhodovibrio salinarum]
MGKAALASRLAAAFLVSVLALGLNACAQSSGMSMQDDASGANDDKPFVKLVDQTKAGRLPGTRLASLQGAGAYPLFSAYQISPGDVLDIVYHLERRRQNEYRISLYHTIAVKFIGASELNETQQVLPDGTISLPYLGKTEVVGLTTTDLEKKLRDAYEDVLQAPEIYVKIENFNARVEQIRNDLQTSARGLSKLVRVRPDGYASFPLVGSVKVAQRTVDSVEQELRGKYANFMEGLVADLFMHEQNGSQVYVLGEVNEPGTVQIDRPINVMQALAEVGGYTREARVSSTIVFRRQDDQLVAHRFDLENMSKYGLQAAQFYLRPDDVLLVPRSKISSTAQLMREIADITFFNGWGFAGIETGLSSGGDSD